MVRTRANQGFLVVSKNDADSGSDPPIWHPSLGESDDPAPLPRYRLVLVPPTHCQCVVEAATNPGRQDLEHAIVKAADACLEGSSLGDSKRVETGQVSISVRTRLRAFKDK